MPQKDNKKSIKIKTGKQAELSPYIIHLAYDKPAMVRKESTPNLDALARSLIIDQEDEPAALPMQDELSIDINALAHQLRESETQVAEMPTIEENTTTILSEIPAVTSAPVETVGVAVIREAIVDLVDAPQEAVVPEEIVVETLELEDEPIEAIEQEIEQAEDILEDRRPWFTFPRFTFAGPRVRAVAAFVTMSFALTLPLHAIQQAHSAQAMEGEITDAGATAIDHFLRGAQALEGDRLDVAEVDFTRASENFSEAEESINNLNSAIATVASVIPETDRTYDSARGLITAGKEFSIAASALTSAASELTSLETLTATTKLTLLSSYVEEAKPHVDAAAEALENVDPDVIPAEYQTLVADLKTRAPELSDSMQEFIDFSNTLVTVMGGERKMRYLVVFQNNTELRPTGGFTGSFAEIDVLNGEIVSINIPPGGTYDVQGQLSQFVAPPQPLTLLDSRWEFHDANWFPDFPTSAKKMLWFYEHAGGPTVDGVLAVNATMMPELLALTGPIEMPEYGRTIDSENFLFETQKIVEFEYEEFVGTDTERTEDAPKQFIGDLAPMVLERLEDADMQTTLAMLDLIGKGLTRKDIILFFENNALQSDIEQLGWSGSLKETSGDYLMVVDTNLGGGKTDTAIGQHVDLYSKVDEDGSIVNTVTITKEHRGLKTELFEGVNNVDYIRLYVPKGSQLLSASGFEIPGQELFEQSEVPLMEDEDLALIMTNQSIEPESKTDIWDESGKTVFGNWIQTKPGETETVTFTYKLPITLENQNAERSFIDEAKTRLGFKDLETHTILIQKQPGVVDRTTSVTVSYPTGKDVVWSSQDGGTDDAAIELTNTEDHFVRFLLENTYE